MDRITKKVVITGMGTYSCVGKNLDEVKDPPYNGKPGIGTNPVRKELDYFSALTGVSERPDLKKLLNRRRHPCLPKQGEYAYLVTLEASHSAGINENFLEANEVGILYDNNSSIAPVINVVDIIREKKNTALVSSGPIFQPMNSTVTMNLSATFKLRGVDFTTVGTCASDSHAVGIGYLLIRSGLQDYTLCGGAQEVNSYTVRSLDGLSAFFTRETAPEKASKPFDRRRNGLIPSGGAASLVLESYESVVKRRAPILAEVIGYGFSSNRDHIFVPNVDGLKRSFQVAIKDVGIALGQVNYINAHATSTLVDDLNETKAIAEIFEGYHPYVTSTESMTGHEMQMAGAGEVIYPTLMVNNGFTVPNLNLEEPDEVSAQLNIPIQRVNLGFDTFLSNSFGFGGANSALIIRKINP